MNLLAIDSSGPILSLALQRGEKIWTIEKESATKPHDEILLPAARSLFNRARLGPERLDAVAAASGPGRFTGIRIGMAYVAVLSGRLKIPALAVSRLEAAALAIPGPRACIAISGPRQEMFYQPFILKSGILSPVSKPSWAEPAAWPAIKSHWEEKGFAVSLADPGAEETLAAARAMLERKKIPPFEPLYLKTGGYEKRPHPPRSRR